MASNDLREELGCSICLEIYRDPVTLRCGHNFCGLCIEDFLKTQEPVGVYSCPVCRDQFEDRSDMRKNTTLNNIAQHFLSIQTEPEEMGIYCTFCDSPVPAAQSCVQCETSMCEDHLRKHNRSVHHSLIPVRGRKSSNHQKIPECSGVESRDEERLHQILEELTAKRDEAEAKQQKLQERRREVQEKAAELTHRVSAMFRDLRRQLEDLENRVLSTITGRELQRSRSLSDRIRKLEAEMEDLSRKMDDILCNKTEPLTFFRDYLCATGEDTNGPREEEQALDGDLGECQIIDMLIADLWDIVAGVKREAADPGDSDIELDINTAGNRVVLSEDMKTVSWSEESQGRPETPERFEYYQVLSTRRVSSGQHWWDMEASEPGRWRIGLCYASAPRKGGQSLLGNNSASWCLRWCDNALAAMYNGKVTPLPHKITRRKMRIHVDYEAGKISFYELCDPLRPLHTFTTTFTEPLHPAFCVWTGWVRVLSRS